MTSCSCILVGDSGTGTHAKARDTRTRANNSFLSAGQAQLRRLMYGEHVPGTGQRSLTWCSTGVLDRRGLDLCR
jgi:hypothetical protein